MQSGYGAGVSDFQQFIMDGCAAASQLFGSAPAVPPPAASAPPADVDAASAAAAWRYQRFHLAAPHHHHLPPPPQPAAHFATAHFAAGHTAPYTQQLLHSHHPFQLFHEPPPPPPAAATAQRSHHRANHHSHRSLGFDVESEPPANSSALPPFLTGTASAMGFRDIGFKPEVDAGAHSDGLGGAGDSSLRLWRGEEESAIKEPSWRPLDIDYISSSSKKSPEASPATPPPAPPAEYFLKNSVDDATMADASEAAAVAAANPATSAGNYKLFSELEAICKPGSGNISVAAAIAAAGSGSAVTGDDHAADRSAAAAAAAVGSNLGIGCENLNPCTSEMSAGEPMEAARRTDSSAGRKRKRRKQRRQQQLSAVAGFLEQLMQRLVEHQELLHRRFLDAVERWEHEREAREEAWRVQEAARVAQEADAREQERAIAAAREVAIIGVLEKIAGEKVSLPLIASNMAIVEFKNGGTGSGNVVRFSSSRWPKGEVQALIRVRARLEGRFQEPGLKGPLWEEVSTAMAALGYERSAKRCKEKWENINKYFRKAKESGKRRPAHAKTCPYFDELDRLYSSPGFALAANADSADMAAAATAMLNGSIKRRCSELLDAVIKFPDIGSGDRDMGADSDAEDTESDGAREDDDEEVKEVAGGEEEAQTHGHGQEETAAEN